MCESTYPTPSDCTTAEPRGSTTTRQQNSPNSDTSSMATSATSANENKTFARICADPSVESHKTFALQAFLPFVLAGCGMVAAGVLLERANGWTFLREMPEATVLVLALLGLKGNLEMTLASRLSTMTNLGQMDTRKQQIAVLISNLALVQAQAIVVSLVAAVLTTVSNILEGNRFDMARTVCLTLTAALTASVASLLLTSLMVLVTITARKWRINPDNITTPLAAATGDVTTLTLMVLFGAIFYEIRESFFFTNLALLALLIISTPFWMWIASRESVTLKVLKFGWFAVLLAMFISSGGGYILRHSTSIYPQIALYQPVINGAGGNLAAVQASKISTYLHRFGKMGVLPANRLRTYLNPLRTFSCQEHESIHACILLLMALPGHLVFLTLFVLVRPSIGLNFDLQFFTFYFAAAIAQVAILLCICQFLSRLIWRMRCDPDNNSIPLLTAFGDLLGTALLAGAFHLNFLLSDDSAEIDRHAEALAHAIYN